MKNLDEKKLEEKHGKELASYLSSWDKEDEKRYSDYYREWEKNILFYLGKQWLEPASYIEGWQIVEPDDHNRYLPVTNYTKRSCGLKRSQILGKRMVAKVSPNSETKVDYDAAKLSTLTLKARHALNSEALLDELAFLHGQIFGFAIRLNYKELCPDQSLKIPQYTDVKTEYFQCPSCGGIQEEFGQCLQCGHPELEFKRDTRQERMTNPDGTEQTVVVPVYRPAARIVDPFTVRLSPANNANSLSWFKITTLESISTIKELYDIEAEGFDPQVVRDLKTDNSRHMPRGVRLSNQYNDSMVKGGSSVQRTVVSGDGEMRDGECVLHRLYLKPTGKRPHGRMILWTHSGVIYDGLPDIPPVRDRRDWHPASLFVYEPHPLRPEGVPYVQELIPINMMINSLDAMILEHTDKMSMPKEIRYSGTVINNDDGTDVLVVDPRPELPGGGVPTYLAPPSLPNELYRLRMEKVAELEKIGNVTEVMQGLRPVGVDTWKGLEFLNSTSLSSEAMLINRWYEFKKHSASMELKLVQDCLYYKDDELARMMETIRENEDMSIDQIRQFTGEDLKNNFNVVFEEADYAGVSKAAEIDMVTTLFKEGLLDGKALQSENLYRYRLMRKLGLDSRFIIKARDCEKMELLVKKLEMVTVENFQQELGLVLKELKRYDDKQIGKDVLVEWMKSARYMTLPLHVQKAGEIVLEKIENDIMQLQKPAPKGPEGPAPMGGMPPQGNPAVGMPGAAGGQQPMM